MRTIDEYMKLPYRLEIIEDPRRRVCGNLSRSKRVYHLCGYS